MASHWVQALVGLGPGGPSSADEIKIRIDPVHQTELREHLAEAGIRTNIGHEFHAGALPVIVAAARRLSPGSASTVQTISPAEGPVVSRWR